LIWLGAVLLAISLPTLIGLGWSFARTTDSARYKPLWWLKLEARYDEKPMAEAALAEVFRRAAIRAIAPSDVADTLKAVIDLRGRIRPVVRIGDRIPIKIEPGPRPAHWKSGPMLHPTYSLREVCVDGVVVADDGMPAAAYGHSPKWVALPSPAWAKVTPGERRVRITFDLNIDGTSHMGGISAGQFVIEQPVRFVTLSQDSVTEIPPAGELPLAFRRAIAVAAPDGEPHAIRLYSAGGRPARTAAVDFDWRLQDVPADHAFAVFAVTPDGQRWPLPPLRGPANEGAWTQSATVHLTGWTGFDADRVDLLLAPDPVLARDSVDMNSIYGGEILIPDVKVLWSIATPPRERLMRRWGDTVSRIGIMPPGAGPAPASVPATAPARTATPAEASTRSSP
jgi:hypothetical protein